MSAFLPVLATLFAFTNTPVSFEGGPDEDTPDPSARGEWSTTESAQTAYGAVTAYSAADSNQVAQLTRATSFIGTTTNFYFTADTGDAILYRTAAAHAAGSTVIPTVTLEEDPIYIDTLACFEPCAAPADTGSDKLLLWCNTAGALCITAGQYESMLAQNLPRYDYETTNIVAGTWHRVVVKMLKPFTDTAIGSAFVVYLDGVPVTSTAKCATDAMDAFVTKDLSDTGRTLYEQKALFPALVSKVENAQKLAGLGLQGSEGKVDDLVITTETPNNERTATTRVFVLTVESDVKQIVYTANGEQQTKSLAGYAGEIPLVLPLGEQTVTIDSISYTESDIRNYSWSDTNGCYAAGNTIYVDGAGTLARATLVPGGQPACRVSNWGGSVTNLNSIGEAIDFLSAQAQAGGLYTARTGAVIRLNKNLTDHAVVTEELGLTLDLSGRTLTDPEGDECCPIYVCGKDITLVVRDSAGTGKVKNPNGGDAVRCIGGRVTITGGHYLNAVVISMFSDEYAAGTLSLTGGRYYDNGGADGFVIPNSNISMTNYVASGYAASWYEAGYWRVARGGSTPVAPTAFMTAYNAIGVTTPATQLDYNGSFELTLGDVTSVTAGDTTTVTCTVTITNVGTDGTTRSVAANAETLKTLVQYSSNLTTWNTPTASELRDCTEEQVGVYRYTLQLPAGQSYFIKLSK